MYIQDISILNFKNYSEATVQFHKKLNCLVGNNGSGKTNLLDAIYYLCMCKSYFNASDAYNINFNEEFLSIQCNFNHNNVITNIHCGIKQGKKKLFRKNKKEYSKLSDHVGNFPVVMVSPADASLILDGGDERRKYMNGVISQYNRDYLEKTIQYSKVLLQRNKLLKDSFTAHFNEELFDVYTEQLIPLGETIHKERKLFVEKLTPIFQHYYTTISEQKEKVAIDYKSNLEEDSFENLLKQAFYKDKSAQHTTFGVHKDDLQLTLNNQPMKRIASQGQQKTFLVALKLAQFAFLKEIKNIDPVLLLDDIFDKFDEMRVKQILKLVASDDFGQIFITHHNQQRMQDLLTDFDGHYSLFKVQNNEIESVNL